MVTSKVNFEKHFQALRNYQFVQGTFEELEEFVIIAAWSYFYYLILFLCSEFFTTENIIYSISFILWMDPISIAGMLVLIIVIMLALKLLLESIEIVFFVLLFFFLVIYFFGISYASILQFVDKALLWVPWVYFCT